MTHGKLAQPNDHLRRHAYVSYGMRRMGPDGLMG